MIIECFGMPGAGKSTLALRLSEEGVFHEIPKYVGRTYALLFAARHPFFLWRFLWIIVHESLKTNIWSLVRFKIAVLLNTIGRLQYARTKFSKSDRVIIDEGLVQRLLSLYETKQSARVFARHLSKMPQSDIVVHVSYVGVLFDKSRVGTQRRSLGKDYETAWRAVMGHNYQSILEALDEIEVSTCAYKHGDHNDRSLEEVRGCLKRNINT